MAFIPAPNIAQVEMRCLRNGQRVENRVMVDMFAPPTRAQLQLIATAYWDWWENQYAVALSQGVLLREVVATDMGVLNGEQFTYAPDTTTTGLRTGGTLPNEVSLCLSLRSGSRGRSARGRLFALSVSLNQMVDDNNISAAAAAEYAAIGNALITAASAHSFALVIVSYRSNNAVRPGGPVYFPVSSVVLTDNTVDSQKRRKPGVGS